MKCLWRAAVELLYNVYNNVQALANSVYVAQLVLLFFHSMAGACYKETGRISMV